MATDLGLRAQASIARIIRPCSKAKWWSSPAPAAASAATSRWRWRARARRSWSTTSAPRSTGEGAAMPARRSRWSTRSARRAARRWPTPTASPSWASANRIVQAALDAFGRIDAVVNNAGILRDRFFHKMSVEEWDAVINVHLYGTLLREPRRGAALQGAGAGCYVHMTSTSGLIGNFGQANYAAAKLGIVGAVEVDRARHGEVQRALQLHRAVRLEPHDRLDPDRDAGPEGARREAEADDDRPRSRRWRCASPATRRRT